MRAVAFGASLASCLFATAASADISLCDSTAGNLVQNCGFEAPLGIKQNIPDWSLSPTGGSATQVADPHSGDWALDLMVTAGMTYAVSFWMQAVAMGGRDASFSVDLEDANGNSLGSWSVTDNGGYTGNHT